jgi:hypothetical protein
MGMLKGIAMADLLLLSEAQVRRIKPYFTLSHGRRCSEDGTSPSFISLAVTSSKARRPSKIASTADT